MHKRMCVFFRPHFVPNVIKHSQCSQFSESSIYFLYANNKVYSNLYSLCFLFIR